MFLLLLLMLLLMLPVLLVPLLLLLVLLMPLHAGTTASVRSTYWSCPVTWHSMQHLRALCRAMRRCMATLAAQRCCCTYPHKHCAMCCMSGAVVSRTAAAAATAA